MRFSDRHSYSEKTSSMRSVNHRTWARRCVDPRDAIFLPMVCFLEYGPSWSKHFLKCIRWQGQKWGPIFGSPIEPAKRVDPLWVHPFCGLHSGPESGRCFLGALAVCDWFLEGGGLRPCWCWTQVKVGSFWVLNQILVSPSVPCHSAISSGGLRWGLVPGEAFCGLWIHLHASAAEKESPGRPFELFCQKGKKTDWDRWQQLGVSWHDSRV